MKTAGLPKYHEISVARFFCAHSRRSLLSTQREQKRDQTLMGQGIDRKDISRILEYRGNAGR